MGTTIMGYMGIIGYILGCRAWGLGLIRSWKLTWKPKKGPIKTTVLLKGDYMGFHVSLGECMCFTQLGGLPKTMGVPIRRIIAFGGPYWGPLALGI